MKEREEDLERKITGLQEERRMFEENVEILEKKKVELKANYDELNHRINILEENEEGAQEY